MRSHKILKDLFESSETMKKYDAIGIITILVIIGWVIDGALILQKCQSPKGIALIIKAGGPLVKLFIRRNIYKKMIAADVPEDDAKILSDNIADLIKSLAVEQLVDLLETIYHENPS